MSQILRTDDYDYELPKELIADHPLENRDDSRLMVVNRSASTVSHHSFRDLPELLQAGDLLVANNSRVLRARLHGVRIPGEGKAEALLLEPLHPGDNRVWRAMCRPGKRLPVGSHISFADGSLRATVTDVEPEGTRILEFNQPDVMPYLEQFGEIPLPPYIVQRRKELGLSADDDFDTERYQTVYGKILGSVAAPTAGLHFTPEVISDLEMKSINFTSITLHVGAGTFKPVEVDDPSRHPIHSERISVSPETAEAVNANKQNCGRTIAVGTTSVRTLESLTNNDGVLIPGETETKLMILPGYRFRMVDAMITNFHLPKSSLLMLVSAFAGNELIRRAYDEAIQEKYRFYSYGDAMLIL